MDKALYTVLSYVKPEHLPSGWALVSVGDVISSTQYGLNTPSEPGGRTPIVGMKDIQGGRVLFRNLARTTVSNGEMDSYRLRKGDVLINRTNSLDQVGKAGIVEDNQEAVFASYLVRLTVNTARWPAPGSKDTELGVLMELEVGHGETAVYAGVQA
jgi:hypothetical protein